MDEPERLGPPAGFLRVRDRLLFEPFVVAPALMSAPLRALAASLVRRGSSGHPIVLSYHAIADHRRDPLLRRYSVPRARFARQLDALLDAGWTFVDVDAVLAAIAGARRFPRRAVLITFDDGYVNFETEALPELERRGIPSVVFVLGSELGGTNHWDHSRRGAMMSLMDADAVRRVAAAGVEIGSHGLAHESMSAFDRAAVAAEASESANRIAALGLPRPRLFAYPYGRVAADAGAETELRSAGYLAAFTIEPGVLGVGENAFALPRLMVLRGFRPPVLRLRIALLRWPAPWLERLFELIGTSG